MQPSRKQLRPIFRIVLWSLLYGAITITCLKIISSRDVLLKLVESLGIAAGDLNRPNWARTYFKVNILLFWLTSMIAAPICFALAPKRQWQSICIALTIALISGFTLFPGWWSFSQVVVYVAATLICTANLIAIIRNLRETR